MEKRVNYWSEEKHKEWKVHYFDGYLAFTKKWAEAHLPPKSEGHNALWCKLLDKESRIVYEMPIYAAYEDQEVSAFYLDYDNWENVSVQYMKLMSYFYESHHCPCHRHTDAVNAGLEEKGVDFECAGTRFEIQSVTPKGSDLILYSETMSDEELEKTLSGHEN